jgi:hypothetical protein
MIDFSKGGYQGNFIEETFKGFTANYMPHYWYFREVLRSSHLPSVHWKKVTGESLAPEDEEAKDLVAISMIMYHVYTCLAEAISFYQALEYEIGKFNSNGTREFEVKRNWKAAYSSLYTSVTSISNLLLIVEGKKLLYEYYPDGTPKNYSPGNAITFFKSRNKLFSDIIKNCQDRLEIRNHLDHYWTIWTSIGQGVFLFDKDFSKGYVVTSPPADGQYGIDARSKLNEDIVNTAKDLDTLFLELSRPGGSLDMYLNTKDTVIDYSDYGAPHHGERPLL